jgi:glucose/arabinose dehydrogenase
VIEGTPATYVAGQGGYFDVVLDPEFATNRLVYLAYAEGTKRANRTAVMRARLEGDEFVETEVILRVEPDKNTAHHYGGRLAFLPDGTLLVTTGEGFTFRDQAQDLDSQFGKVLRINTDGSVPPDNPFAERGGRAAKIWSYGHRNPQGLAVDPVSGTVWLHEHGPRGGDEVNRIEPGRNYGWPAITYGVDYSGAQISPYTEYPGMEQPVTYWDPSIAPSGLAVYRGDAFPAWRGNLFVGALKDRDVRRLAIENGAVVAEETLFEALGERIRDVRAGPDGFLYLLTDSSDGRLVRVSPGR